MWVPNTDTLPYRGTSAGGGYATVGDLARFAHALLSHELLDPDSTTRLLAGKTEMESGIRYAYGFFDARRAGGDGWVGHGGGAPGMNGDLRIYPKSVTNAGRPGNDLPMTVSDEDLLVASVSDEEAFASFYRRHAKPLAGFFMRRTAAGCTGSRGTSSRARWSADGSRTAPAGGSAWRRSRWTKRRSRSWRTRTARSGSSCNAYRRTSAPRSRPIVDEPIPQAIASTMAIFREPRPIRDLSGVRVHPQAAKLYAGAVELRPRNERRPGPRAIVIAADIVPFPPDHDVCAPPPGATEPGVCLTASAPEDEEVVAARCFTIEEIEAADTWLDVTPRVVIGLAPDGADRVIFGAGKRTDSLEVSRNAFGGALRPGISPREADTRFAP